MEKKFIYINPNTYEGGIPTNYNLVITEKGEEENEESAMILYGFDEIGMFDANYTNPVYGFLIN